MRQFKTIVVGLPTNLGRKKSTIANRLIKLESAAKKKARRKSRASYLKVLAEPVNKRETKMTCQLSKDEDYSDE